MSRRILVPIDGSTTSNRGLAEAIKLAKSQKAKMCLLHVVDERSVTLAPEMGGIYADRLMDLMRGSGRKVLAKAAAAARKRGIKAATVMVESITRPVADVIVGQARKWGADLIVLGTHGRRGLSRLVMGSDAEGVVRTATVPVLLVRAPGARQR
jgi:nucleotide-binding universal stress UspA family protein